MCPASSGSYFLVLGCLTVTVLVKVFALPPLGVNVTFKVNFKVLFVLSAFLAVDERLSEIAWAPALPTVTFLIASFTALPFLGLAEEAMLSLPAPGHWTESLIVVPLTRADGIVIALLTFAGGGVTVLVGGGVTVPAGGGVVVVVHGRPEPSFLKPIAATALREIVATLAGMTS